MFKAMLATIACAAAFAVSAQPATFAIDPDHTVVTFSALHVGTSTQRGRIQAKEGSVVLDKTAKTGKADITLDMASISTAATSLQGTLRGERFFNVAANPTARFVADTFTFNGDKVASVAGNLTLNGKTQPVTLRAARFN